MLTTCCIDNCHVISIGKIQWKKLTAENWTQQMNLHQLTRLGSLSRLPMRGALKCPGGRGWLLIGKLWSEAASWISSSISTICWADFSLPNTFWVTGIVDDFWKQTMAQDMAFGGGLRKFLLKNFDPTVTGRLCIRSDQGLILEDNEKCVSGTCRILFRATGNGSGNDANVSALTKEWNLKIVALEKEIPFVKPSCSGSSR